MTDNAPQRGVGAPTFREVMAWQNARACHAAEPGWMEWDGHPFTTRDDKREIVGLHIGPSEAEPFWTSLPRAIWCGADCPA